MSAVSSAIKGAFAFLFSFYCGNRNPYNYRNAYDYK